MKLRVVGSVCSAYLLDLSLRIKYFSIYDFDCSRYDHVETVQLIGAGHVTEYCSNIIALEVFTCHSLAFKFMHNTFKQ